MKNIFIKNTLILIIGGLVTKIMGMLIKIIMTRNITTYALSLYMLTLPTYNLFITIVTLSLQISISKLVSEEEYDEDKILSNSLIISLIISFISIFILLLITKPITIVMHNKDLYYPLLSIILSIPFISISNSIRGYLFGKNKMFVQVISNFCEQIIRIILFITILPTIKNEIMMTTFIIGSNIINELLSIIIMSFFIPKRNIRNFKYDRNISKKILKISIPTTLSRLLGVISYFFEPIILTNLLLINGYSNEYITTKYGIITGYTLSLLMLPSFFTNAISQTIIPLISKAFVNKNYLYIKNKIREVIILSLIIAISFISIIVLKKDFIMNFIYKTNKGIEYINILSPVFILLYLEGPIISILQSLNKQNITLIGTIIGIIIKYISMIIFCLLKFGIYSFIISMILNILFVVLFDFIYLKKATNSFV